MKEHFVTYLSNERLFSLTASLVGLTSILFAIALLWFQPNLRSFALSLFVLGALEVTVFSISYFGAGKRINDTLALLESKPASEIEFQKEKTAKSMTTFFVAKMIYAVVFVAAILLLSKGKVGDVFSGILIALILHVAFAAALDSLGERYTQKFKTQLNQSDVR